MSGILPTPGDSVPTPFRSGVAQIRIAVDGPRPTPDDPVHCRILMPKRQCCGVDGPTASSARIGAMSNQDRSRP